MRPAYLAAVAHGGAYALAECRQASGSSDSSIASSVAVAPSDEARYALARYSEGSLPVVPAERACEAAPTLVADS